jgi:hypothetical protein
VGAPDCFMWLTGDARACVCVCGGTGWDDGMVGTKKNGRRYLVIPAAMAYGNKGSPPAIPANATLIFDVRTAPMLSVGSMCLCACGCAQVARA